MDYSNKTNEQLITLLLESRAELKDAMDYYKWRIDYLETRDKVVTDATFYSIRSYSGSGKESFDQLSADDAQKELERLGAIPNHFRSDVFRHCLYHRAETEQIHWERNGDKITNPS